jgi:hypothetical protein
VHNLYYNTKAGLIPWPISGSTSPANSPPSDTPSSRYLPSDCGSMRIPHPLRRVHSRIIQNHLSFHLSTCRASVAPPFSIPTSRLTARLVRGTPCAFGTSRPLSRPRLVRIVVGSSHCCGTDSGRVGSGTVEFAASNQREGSWCPRWQWRRKQGDAPAACCAALMPASGTNLRTERILMSPRGG